MSIMFKLNDDNSIEDEVALALAAQEEEVIKLYPVPFKNNLTKNY